MLGEMTQSDVIVWVIRANRPARKLDATLKLQLDEWFEAHPRRRKPVILVVASAIDQVLGESVSAQHPPSVAAQDTIAAAVSAIAKDLPDAQVLPVAMGASQWNLDAVADALRQELDEAKRVQRNRRRVTGAVQERRLRHQLKKLARLGKGKKP
jgi:predicted GTPase